MSKSRKISLSELAAHNLEGDAWISVEGNVYNVSKFAELHPGGFGPLMQQAGKECTAAFFGFHRAEVLEKYSRLKVGELVGKKPEDEHVRLSEISGVPFAEVAFWQGGHSPYYNNTHIAFRKAVREFFDTKVRPEAERFEQIGKPPSEETFRKMGAFGILASRLGPEAVRLASELNLAPALPGGISVEEFDYFHEMIAHEELARIATPGYCAGLGDGMVIGLAPVLQFGPDWMKSKVGQEVLSGKERICLAISEPTAGSDVANIQTTAVRQGDHYIVNGTKKWITNGCQSKYFVTAARTGPQGMGGVSMILIERSEGVSTDPIKTSYSSAAGTAYVGFRNVRVPCKNILGQENGGFSLIMYNFNHERWMIICMIVAANRGMLEECMKWCTQRKVFGKTLMQQPVIRQKLAKLIAGVESSHSWLERVTHEMCTRTYIEAALLLASQIALLKFQVTRVASMIADEAVQIFGGRGITETGMGKMAARFNRTYKFGAILGGSEEIMADLGVRLAAKGMPKNARL